MGRLKELVNDNDSHDGTVNSDDRKQAAQLAYETFCRVLKPQAVQLRLL